LEEGCAEEIRDPCEVGAKTGPMFSLRPQLSSEGFAWQMACALLHLWMKNCKNANEEWGDPTGQDEIPVNL